MAEYNDVAAAPSDVWAFAGYASSFPNIVSSSSTSRLTNTVSTRSGESVPICKILKPLNSNSATHELLSPTEAAARVGLEQQVLIFQYRGRFHAVDHQCPHRSFPLSRGTLYDIEDFGIKLSVGLTCPKHGWAFDIFTGESDRGTYRLKVWDVEVRGADRENGCADERQIWVKQRDEK